MTAGMCWFGVCWGYGTDVSRTGYARLGSETLRVSFYASLVGGGLRPHQGGTVVFGYIEVPGERYAPNIYSCIRT